MNREKIFEKVKRIIVGQMVDQRGELVKGDSKLMQDLGLDSLDGMAISMELDKEFKINTSDDDINRINDGTVDDVVDLVVEHLTNQNRYEK